MSAFTCPGCNTRFRLPPGAEGRKVRCTKCGRVSQVPAKAGDAGPIPLAGEPDDFFDEAAAAATRSREPAPGSQIVVHDPAVSNRRVLEEAEEMVRVGRSPDRRTPGRGFWADVGWSFFFVTTPNNAVTFMVVWGMSLMAGIAGAIPGIGILSFLINGLICAFLLNCVSESAGGDDDLPSLRFSDGWWEDVVRPMFKFLGLFLVLAMPSLLYLSIAVGRTSQGTPGAVNALLNPIATLTVADATIIIPFVLLAGAGVLLAPIATLMVAIGNLSDLIRMDLIVRTVVRTFLPYVAISLLTAGAFTAYFVVAYALDRAAVRGTLQVNGIAIVLLLEGVNLYLNIVTMRIIGLYYRHFKDRFAWSWE